MGRVTDETGNRYGRLTVVRRDPENAYHKGANWICRCDCGGERVASGIGLRQGMVKSCGCLARERRVLRCACGYKGQKTRNWTPDWKCFRCSGLSPLADPPKMTEDELFEKRVEHWRYYHRSAPTSASHDVMLFLERLERVTRERDEARANYQWMVDRACDEKLDGYRELAAKCAQLEEERDEARARCETLRELADVAAYEQGVAQRRMMDAQRKRDEARADAERAIIDRDHAEARARAYLIDDRDDFRRGAEAMRKRCAMWIKHNSHEDGLGMGSQRIESALAALPIPEEP